MPSLNLTDRTIKHLALPTKGQTLYWDTTLRGLALRVSSGGAKTFVAIMGRERYKKTIGRYPTITLTDARTTARKLLAEYTLGKRDTSSISYTEARSQYLDDVASRLKPRTVADYTRLLNRHYRLSGQLRDLRAEQVLRCVTRLRDVPSFDGA